MARSGSEQEQQNSKNADNHGNLTPGSVNVLEFARESFDDAVRCAECLEYPCICEADNL